MSNRSSDIPPPGKASPGNLSSGSAVSNNTSSNRTASNHPSPPSPLQQALALHRAGRLAEAETAYRALLAQAPQHFNLLQLLGTVCAQQQRHAQAVDYLQQALALDASLPAVHHNLGNALHSLGRHAEAVLAYTAALALQPTHTEALVSRGNSLHALAQYPQALASYEQALEQQPAQPAVLVNRGSTLRALAREEEALASCERALQLEPASAEALFNIANTLLALARHDQALQVCERLLALQPGHTRAWLTRGNVLCRLRRMQEALASYRTALRHDASLVDAWNALGMVLMTMQRRVDALAAFDRALALQPDCIDALRNKGDALMLGKTYGDAAACYEQILALDAATPNLQGALYSSRHHICDWRDHEQARDRIIADVQAGLPACSPFVFVSLCDDPAAQLQCAQRFTADHFPPAPEPLWRGEPYRHTRIRVGYLSANFHNHAVAWHVAELFELHDRSAFECFAYSFGPERTGAIRARLERAFEHFTDVTEWSDAALAQQLRDDEIDIAVDLMGYTLHCRPGVFARRPAPVTMSYIGYPGSMGAPWMDYILADAVVVPPGTEQHCSEQVLRLPHSYQVNDRQREIATLTPARKTLGLPERGFVFCCFNNSYKLTPAMFSLWMRLLAAVEGSVLWLVADGVEVETNLRREAEQRGVDPARLVFAARCSLPEHLARLRCADLFLDTLPYNAHATASDTLWAGVPLLTCTGRGFASRVAASLLHALDLPELVTASPEAYEARALQLARDPAAVAALKQKLAANRLTAPLYDTPRFTRDLETAFRQMHARSEQGLPPQGFSVAP